MLRRRGLRHLVLRRLLLRRVVVLRVVVLRVEGLVHAVDAAHARVLRRHALPPGRLLVHLTPKRFAN